MVVRYVPIDNELVSRAWFAVLRDMRADGVDFVVNEGHRTLERQSYFYGCGPNGCCCCNNCNLAARPSPFAPHIRTGRADHAVDFGGDIDGVLRWLDSKGLVPIRPAGSGSSWEPWHIEVSLSRLLIYARKHGASKLETLPKHVEHAARVLIARRKTLASLIEARDSVSSKTHRAEWIRRNVRVAKAAAARDRSFAEVRRLLHRSKNSRTRGILHEILYP